MTKYFSSEKEAKRFASKKSVELANDGRRHAAFNEQEKQAVLEARRIASQFESQGVSGFSIQAAISHYTEHLKNLQRSSSLKTALTELLSVRRAEGKSERHLKDIEHRAGRFVADFSDRLVASITTQEVSSWLLGLKCESQTRLNHKRVLHNFLSFCRSRGYSRTNPVAALSIKVSSSKPIGILTLTQTGKILAAASPEILPALAIGLFAGLRREEISRLDWSEIDLNRGFIEVKALKSKTAKRRLVTATSNLNAWLKPRAKDAGAVCPTDMIYRLRLGKACKTSKIANWPHNALRHSFASYHLAMHSDAAKTALELGHTESATLFRHYRELVHPEDAQKYWAILPP